MFPLQRGNELVIKFSSSPHQQQHKIPEDLILDEMITSSQPREQFFRAEMSKDHHKSKKIMVHREIERKRRQDMASFYASLRSLLPLEFIKVRNLQTFNKTFFSNKLLESTLLSQLMDTLLNCYSFQYQFQCFPMRI